MQKRQILWSILLLAYSAMIYRLSSGPVQLPAPPFFAQDKWLHAMAYGLMVWLAWHALRPPSHPGWWAWLYAAGFGATDEWHQSFVPGRQADLWDWVADAVGAALVWWFLSRRMARGGAVSPGLPLSSEES
ncbi:MAG: VanZ family protein [Magnetococcales bacterium]|nr:VanZ family protein [Magnetococcales bacterium]